MAEFRMRAILLAPRRCLLAALVALIPVAAFGHAVLVESTPAHDGTVAAGTTQAVLRFNAKIEKRVTRLTLLDASGHDVKMPPLPDDREGSVDRLLIALPELGAGTYRLEYRVLASDGHTSPGIIRFSVGAATAPSTAPSTPPATAPAIGSLSNGGGAK